MVISAKATSRWSTHAYPRAQQRRRRSWPNQCTRSGLCAGGLCIRQIHIQSVRSTDFLVYLSVRCVCMRVCGFGRVCVGVRVRVDVRARKHMGMRQDSPAPVLGTRVPCPQRRQPGSAPEQPRHRRPSLRRPSAKHPSKGKAVVGLLLQDLVSQLASEALLLGSTQHTQWGTDE